MANKEKFIIATGCIWILGIFIAYFYVFNSGLSTNQSDWGSFGSYITGMVTLPFSVISAFLLYRTYAYTKSTYNLSVNETRINITHQAIKEAAMFLEAALESKVNIENDELSFREINYNPRAARKIMGFIESHDDLNTHYRVTVGKAFLCLYDFLRSSEATIGQTDIIKFYKIRYQWIITLHNEYNLKIIEHRDQGIYSKDIYNYFYSTGKRK